MYVLVFTVQKEDRTEVSVSFLSLSVGLKKKKKEKSQVHCKPQIGVRTTGIGQNVLFIFYFFFLSDIFLISWL